MLDLIFSGDEWAPITLPKRASRKHGLRHAKIECCVDGVARGGICFKLGSIIIFNFPFRNLVI